MTLAPGARLGPYEILETAGQGGMGIVYRARDPRLDRDVAIKLVTAPDEARAKARLLREARHASALNHPGICTVHEVGEVDGQPYIVMEYVEGRTLADAIPEAGFPAEVVTRHGAQIWDRSA